MKILDTPEQTNKLISETDGQLFCRYVTVWASQPLDASQQCKNGKAGFDVSKGFKRSSGRHTWRHWFCKLLYCRSKAHIYAWYVCIDNSNKRHTQQYRVWNPPKDFQSCKSSFIAAMLGRILPLNTFQQFSLVGSVCWKLVQIMAESSELFCQISACHGDVLCWCSLSCKLKALGWACIRFTRSVKVSSRRCSLELLHQPWLISVSSQAMTTILTHCPVVQEKMIKMMGPQALVRTSSFQRILELLSQCDFP